MPASRVAFLVDAAAYFAAVFDAIAQAQRSIFILSWDIHSRLRLLAEDRPRDGLPAELGPLLDAVTRKRPALQVYILNWNFSALYAFEREAFPWLRFRRGPRLHYRSDRDHPLGASHHQKLVVVDDAIAFVGGIDLAANRWDTPAHAPHDPRRVNEWRTAFGPSHDVQIAVGGEAATALGELARERWRRATGEPPDASGGRGNHWPLRRRADLADVTVSIARTEPAWSGRPQVREVEALYVDSIAAARESLYIENQYLTSTIVRQALAARLEQRDGPEVVIVGPRRCPGWLETATMGAGRSQLLVELEKCDRFDRLRVFYPRVPTDCDIDMVVHSKVMVIDDTFLRIGSSNLSNRSMGFDTECDVAIESEGRADVRTAIRRFRDGLLAEHLGRRVEEVAALFARTGSLAATADRLCGGERTLAPLDAHDGSDETLMPAKPFVDPDCPPGIEELTEEVLPEELKQDRRRALLRAAAVVVLLGVLAASWRWTPLREAISPEAVEEWVAILRTRPFGPLLAVVLFAGASLLMIPVTVLIASSALVLGPWLGFACALAGSLVSASAAYAAGRALWREAVRRFAGPRLNRISRAIAKRGVLAVASFRLLPVAPFTVVNLVAGASHIRFRDYLIGTAIAMTPGILLTGVLADRLAHLVWSPDLPSAGVVAALVAVCAAAGVRLRGRLLRARAS